MASRTLLRALVVLLAVGCAPQQQVDREAERNAILEADRAWSQTPPNADEFVAFFMDDGLSLGGLDAMVAGWKRASSDEGQE